MEAATVKMGSSTSSTRPQKRAAGSFTISGSTVTVEIVRRVEDVDAVAWNAVLRPHDIFHDLALLHALETMYAPEGAIPRYLIFRESSGRPIATACLYTYTIDATVMAEKKHQGRFRRFVSRCLAPLFRTRLVMCGLPLSTGESSLRFAPGANVAAVVQALDEVLRDVARQDRARCILLKEFREEELPQLASLEQHGYLRADSLPVNQQQISHSSFEEFLCSLGNKRRGMIRRSMRKFASSGIEWQRTSDPAVVAQLYSTDVHKQYEAVLNKSSTQFERLPASFAFQLVSNLPNNSEILFAMKDGEVVGFGIAVFNKDEYIPLIVGLDYLRSRESELYFNLLYETFDIACQRGSKRLNFGQNADDCKRIRFGCAQAGRYFFVRGAKPWVHFALRCLAGRLFPSHPVRQPDVEKAAAETTERPNHNPTRNAA